MNSFRSTQSQPHMPQHRSKSHLRNPDFRRPFFPLSISLRKGGRLTRRNKFMPVRFSPQPPDHSPYPRLSSRSTQNPTFHLVRTFPHLGSQPNVNRLLKGTGRQRANHTAMRHSTATLFQPSITQTRNSSQYRHDIIHVRSQHQPRQSKPTILPRTSRTTARFQRLKQRFLASTSSARASRQVKRTACDFGRLRRRGAYF